MAATWAERREVARIPVGELALSYLPDAVPVVVTGMTEAWPARASWSFDALARRVGARPVRVALAAEHGFDPNPLGGSTVELPFDELLARLGRNDEESRRYYLRQNLAQVHPSLVDDVVPPREARPSRVTNLWLGPAGTSTPLHFDVWNNLNAQLLGRKRVLMFSPFDTARLYPHDAGTPLGFVAKASALRPALERFPALAQAALHEAVLTPGDVLYLPPFWWHEVENLELSCSVNFWWPPRARQRLVPNGVRDVPELFRADCLAGLAHGALAPEGLTLLEAARSLVDVAAGAAVLLAAAALCEASRTAVPAARGAPSYDELRAAMRGAEQGAPARLLSSHEPLIEAALADPLAALDGGARFVLDVESLLGARGGP